MRWSWASVLPMFDGSIFPRTVSINAINASKRKCGHLLARHPHREKGFLRERLCDACNKLDDKEDREPEHGVVDVRKHEAGAKERAHHRVEGDDAQVSDEAGNKATQESALPAAVLVAKHADRATVKEEDDRAREDNHGRAEGNSEQADDDASGDGAQEAEHSAGGAERVENGAVESGDRIGDELLRNTLECRDDGVEEHADAGEHDGYAGCELQAFHDEEDDPVLRAGKRLDLTLTHNKTAKVTSWNR